MVFNFDLDAYWAADNPAGPPPIITTSYMLSESGMSPPHVPGRFTLFNHTHGALVSISAATKLLIEKNDRAPPHFIMN
jgi:hypothetical protein